MLGQVTGVVVVNPMLLKEFKGWSVCKSIPCEGDLCLQNKRIRDVKCLRYAVNDGLSNVTNRDNPSLHGAITPGVSE